MFQLKKNKQPRRIYTQRRQVVAQRLIVSVKDSYWLSNGFLKPIKRLSVPMMPIGDEIDQFNSLCLIKQKNLFVDGFSDAKEFLQRHFKIFAGTHAAGRGCPGRPHSPKPGWLRDMSILLMISEK